MEIEAKGRFGRRLNLSKRREFTFKSGEDVLFPQIGGRSGSKDEGVCHGHVRGRDVCGGCQGPE